MSETSNDIKIIGKENHPPTESVKLHGPPGTGKTTQTMERLKHLANNGYSVNDICFITYRRSMAERFLQRLEEEELISYAARKEPWKHRTRYIGTLHAVCNRLTDLESPSDGNRSIQSVMHDFCQEEYSVPYFRSGQSVDSTPGELMFSARSWCIENEQPLEKWHRSPQYDEIVDSWEYHPELTDFDARWEEEKSERGISDFEDMLTTVRDQELAPPRKIIAVDEYHDFTPLQDSIARIWMDQADIVIVNGDPLQVVYSYKGADPDFYTDLEYPEILLPQSWRVPSNVWDFACEALTPEHTPPPIEPKDDPGEVTEIISEDLGADHRGDSDRHSPGELVERYGSDIMFLARTRKQCRDIGSALKDAGVIFWSQEGSSGWNQADKRLGIYNCLSALAGCKEPSGYSGQQSITKNDWSEGKEPASIWAYGSEWATFFDRVPAKFIDGKTKSNLETYLRNEKRLTGDEIADFVTPRFWRLFTNGGESVEPLLSYDDAGVIARALRRYGCEEKRGRFDTMLQTIHASKGGEAETVVLYDGIPTRVATETHRNPSEARNEARLWYVGCTRAEERLVVARNGWDWVREYLPELNPELAGESTEATA